MTIRETLPNRSLEVVIRFVDENGKLLRKETYQHGTKKKLPERVLDLEYLTVIPLQSKYIFFVRFSD